MKKIIFSLTILVMALGTSFQSVNGDEILLKNGNRIDYGPTWEKNGMVWFYFHDYGVAGITKAAIVDKKGFLGSVRGKNFISSEYSCEISVPSGWRVSNAVEALDFMPMEENKRQEYKKLQPRKIMGKMGFLAIIFQGDSWNTQEYNPHIMIKIKDKDKFPGVETPLDYLKNSEFLLSSLYRNFKLLERPQPFVLNNLPSAKQKFSCNMVVNGEPLNITQWQYAFIKNKKVYLVAALNTTEDFRNTERLFLKTLKSFRFID